ncbi:hypothetical protein LDL36_20960 [Komagataeibacter sp. FNDCR1]|nr:hypothetical protein [Komagataeibacter sp. FNDCR1]
MTVNQMTEPCGIAKARLLMIHDLAGQIVEMAMSDAPDRRHAIADAGYLVRQAVTLDEHPISYEVSLKEFVADIDLRVARAGRDAWPTQMTVIVKWMRSCLVAALAGERNSGALPSSR